MLHMGISGALLDFCVSAGDTVSVLGDHLAKASAHAKYTSPVIQNDIANILCDQIKQTILNQVRRAEFFSLMLMRLLAVPTENSFPLS